MKLDVGIVYFVILCIDFNLGIEYLEIGVLYLYLGIIGCINFGWVSILMKFDLNLCFCLLMYSGYCRIVIFGIVQVFKFDED